MNFYKALNFIRNTIETVGVASVKSLKAHIFGVKVTNEIKVSNFPSVQNVKGKIEVTNLEDVAMLNSLNVVIDKLANIKKAVEDVDIPENISVKNFPIHPNQSKKFRSRTSPRKCPFRTSKTS